VRREIQNSKESLKKLAKRYSITPNTVAKWRKRDYVHDSKMGPKVIRSTVLTIEEEAICVAFRKSTLLPLDDCLFALRETIPNLSRLSLHRLFQRIFSYRHYGNPHNRREIVPFCSNRQDVKVSLR
jgi:hypothetical protein